MTLVSTVNATTTVEIDTTTLNSTQHNVTFTIGINSSSISAGQAVRISYSITNLDPSCTKNLGTGGCDPITSNMINPSQIRIWFERNLTYQTISKTLYGIQSANDYFDMTVPAINAICYDIKAELVYTDVNDNALRVISSNIIQRGTCLARNTTNNPCYSYLHCQDGLFCLDSDNSTALDTCKSSSTSYGYLCEQYGEGTKERVSALDSSCRFAYSGLQNRNLLDGTICTYRQDCVNSYCWDSNGDANTECNSATTAGNSTGIIASSLQDCSSSACFSNWQCYSSGSGVIINQLNYTCQNGNLIAPAADIKAEYRNVTYIFTYVSKNSTHIIVNATFTNNESSTFTLLNSYFYIGNRANTSKSINAALTQGQSRTDQYVITKPISTIPRYYFLTSESLITNSTTYWWVTSNLRCYDSVLDKFGEGETCYSIPPTYSLNSTNSTFAGRKILHSLNWTDNIGLSGYIFSFDNGTGTLVNDTWTAFSGTWSNVTKTVNSTVGTTIRWCVYANDSSDNWNGTSCTNPFSYVITPLRIIITINSNRMNSANQIVARPNNVILLYGRAYYVDGAVIPNTAIYFNYSTTVLGSNNTDASGNYYFVFSIPYSGNYTLTAAISDAEGTTGYNTSILYIASAPANVKYRLSYHFGSSASNDVEKTGNYNETVDSLGVSRFFYSSDPNLAHAYTCTYDSSYNPSQLLSLIHSYQRNNLNYINFTSNAALTDYILELSQKIAGSSLIIAYTKGTCNLIDNSMYLVESNQIPSRPFASFSFGIPSEIPFLIRAKYDKIALNGSDVFGSGTSNICVSNDAITASNYQLVTVKRC